MTCPPLEIRPKKCLMRVFVRGQWWLITGRGTRDNQVCIIYPHGTFNRFLMFFTPKLEVKWKIPTWLAHLFVVQMGGKNHQLALPYKDDLYDEWVVLFFCLFLKILKKGNHGNHGSCCYETLILRYTHKMIGSSMVSLPRSTDRLGTFTTQPDPQVDSMGFFDVGKKCCK